MQKKAPGGAILMLVLIFSVILSTLGLAVIYIFGMQEIASRGEIANSKALYLANAGIEQAKGWLIKKQLFPEYVNAGAPFALTNFNLAYPEGVSPGLIDVSIWPKAGNRVNIGPPDIDGYYALISSGTMPGPGYSTVKNISVYVYISTKAWNSVDQSSFTFEVVPNSWNEKPTKRI